MKSSPPLQAPSAKVAKNLKKQRHAHKAAINAEVPVTRKTIAPERRFLHPLLHAISIGFLISLGVWIYGRTLPYPMVFDDCQYLQSNPIFKDPANFFLLKDFESIATLATREGLDPDLSTNFLLRPVTYLTFYWNYASHGMETASYRMVNIGIHCANAILVYVFLWQLILLVSKSRPVSRVSAVFITTASAVAFVVHPLQIESVTYVVQRFTSLAAFFYLATLIAHLRSIAARRTVATVLWRILSVVSLVLGMLSKESTITAPLALILIDCCILRTPWKQAFRRAWPQLLCLPIIPILVLLISWLQHDLSLDLSVAYNIANAVDQPILAYHYILTELSVALTYLSLIVAPLGLNVDWHYPLSTGFWQWPVLRSLAMILSLLGGAWYLSRRLAHDIRASLIFTFVAWYFLSIFVPAGLVPLPDVMAEHRAYLGSFAILAALICAADLLRTLLAQQRRWLSAVIPVLASLWIVAAVYITFQRNEDWSSASKLWRNAVSQCPQKSRSWYNLGMALYTDGQKEESISCLKKSLELNPKFGFAYLSLGSYQAAMGQYREAIDTFKTGVQFFPDSSNLLYDLGVLSFQVGDKAAALRTFQDAVHHSPDHALSHIWLGRMAAETHDYGVSLRHFRIAAMYRPDDSDLKHTVEQLEGMQHQGSPAPEFITNR